MTEKAQKPWRMTEAESARADGGRHRGEGGKRGGSARHGEVGQEGGGGGVDGVARGSERGGGRGARGSKIAKIFLGPKSCKIFLPALRAGFLCICMPFYDICHSKKF